MKFYVKHCRSCPRPRTPPARCLPFLRHPLITIGMREWQYSPSHSSRQAVRYKALHANVSALSYCCRGQRLSTSIGIDIRLQQTDKFVYSAFLREVIRRRSLVERKWTLHLLLVPLFAALLHQQFRSVMASPPHLAHMRALDGGVARSFHIR